MMKKLTYLLALLLLASFVFVGCGDPVTLDHTVVPGEAYPGREGFYIAAEESYGELDILDLQYFNGVVLFTIRDNTTGEVALSTYDIHTGARSDRLESRVVSAPKFKSGFSPDGRIYAFDATSNAITFYDSSLRETKKSNFVNVTVDDVYVGTEYAFCISENSVFRVDLGAGEPEKLASFAELEPSSLYFIGTVGDELFIAGRNQKLENRLISCNIESGKCTDKGEFKGKLYASDGLAVNDAYEGGTLSVYDERKPALVSALTLFSCDEFFLGAGKGMVCTSQNNVMGNTLTQTLRVYSLSHGRLVASADFASAPSLVESSIREVFIVDSDFALFEVVENNTSKLVFWKYSDSSTDDDRSDVLLVSDADAIRRAKNEKLCAEISEKYGVDIVFGEEAVKYYPDYVVVPENDEGKIGTALLEVASVLEKFPEGFFSELKQKSYYNDLSIVLCKRLLPSYRGSLGSAAGYYIGMGDTQHVLLSTEKNDIVNTLSHELFHAVEDVMSAYSYTAFSLWKSYNPEGFEYKNSYVDENGKEYGPDTLYKYTPGDPDSISDGNKVYFFDYYSQTYEKEDRARTFEMLMANELSPYFASQNLKNKAEYLCVCLDDFFECVDASADAAWTRIFK